VIHVCRLAVAERRILLGAIGDISTERLARIRVTLSAWIAGV
jgi:hypothetical protein